MCIIGFSITNITLNAYCSQQRTQAPIILYYSCYQALNPGPRRPRFSCDICDEACKTSVIACDDCDKWIHKSCLDMTTDEFNNIGNSDEKWTCPSCSKQNNSSSIVYHVPENPQESTINLSIHPSRLDSLSGMSLTIYI